MDNKNPRRGMDVTVRAILSGLTLMLIGQGIGALIYAAQLDQRVSHIEEYIKKIATHEARIINNTLKGEINNVDQQKIIESLTRIENRQRKIELNIARLSK